MCLYVSKLCHFRDKDITLFTVVHVKCGKEIQGLVVCISNIIDQ